VCVTKVSVFELYDWIILEIAAGSVHNDHFMRTLYFDCYAGISGDMITGALLDLGLDFAAIEEQLGTLGLTGYELSFETVQRGGLKAARFKVVLERSEQPHRHLENIQSIINRSELSPWAKRNSLRVFESLAKAEARVHGSTINEVHFHEVGAIDSIIDIAAAMIGFEMLGVERFCCSPLRVGFGSVNTEHGVLPVPAPATAELLKGKPIYGGDIEGEFVTPTGAAIVATLCDSFGALPSMKVGRIGYGAGSRDPAGFSNTLRIAIGESETAGGKDCDQVAVIETNIDDMNPQVCGFVAERAFALGALDVFTSPILMKKNRPGILLTILCDPAKLDPMTDLLLRETTTLGVRYYTAARKVLARRIELIDTSYGSVRVKVALQGGREIHSQPEYEDCARIAREQGIPIIEVQRLAAFAYGQRQTQHNDTDAEFDEESHQ